MSLPEDILIYIYKLYFTNNIIYSLKHTADFFELRRHFTNNVLDQMKLYSTGDHVTKLINKFIKDHPNNFYVINWNIQYWDTIYYMMINAHLCNDMDIFLFDNLKDAMQRVRFTS